MALKPSIQIQMGSLAQIKKVLSFYHLAQLFIFLKVVQYFLISKNLMKEVRQEPATLALDQQLIYYYLVLIFPLKLMFFSIQTLNLFHQKIIQLLVMMLLNFVIALFHLQNQLFSHCFQQIEYLLLQLLYAVNYYYYFKEQLLMKILLNLNLNLIQ